MDLHKTGSYVLVGVGGGGWAICHSVTNGEWRMGMGSGESDRNFGTDVGKWGAEGGGIFFGGACRRGKKQFFHPMCLCSRCQNFFVENSKIGDKQGRHFDPLTRPPSRPLAAGPSIFHPSPVTRGPPPPLCNPPPPRWGGLSLGPKSTGNTRRQRRRRKIFFRFHWNWGSRGGPSLGPPPQRGDRPDIGGGGLQWGAEVSSGGATVKILTFNSVSNARYDRLLETESYVEELQGTPKKAERLLSTVSYYWRTMRAALNHKISFGRVDVGIGEPISIQEHMRIHRTKSPSTLQWDFESNSLKVWVCVARGVPGQDRVKDDKNASHNGPTWAKPIEMRPDADQKRPK